MKRLVPGLLMMLLFVACNKEASNEFIPDPNNPQNDTTWTTGSIDANAAVNQLMQSLALPYLTDSLDVSTGGILHFDDHGEIKLPDNCLDQSVTGKVKVEYLYLKSKGDMVRYAKPTVSGNQLLVSGGAFYLKVSGGSTNYQLATNTRFSISYAATSPDKQMKFFYGDTSVNSMEGFTWQPVQDTVPLVGTWTREDSTGVLTGYTLLSSKFGWINCDRFADTSAPRTRLVDTLPINFTNKNTAVFAVFKDQWSVMRLSADATNKYFYADNVPVGASIILLSISQIGNDLYLGSKTITVNAGSIEGFDPQITTKEKLESFIDAL